MAIDSKFLVLTKEALKNKVSNLDSSWTTILINGDLAYSTKGADAGLANNLCVNADLLKAIITGNLRYEAKAEDNFLLDGDYYTLKNINGINVPYALKQVLDFIALLKKPYTVEFRDGSTVLSTLTIYWNSKVTKPTDPTKSGYNFTGWTPSWNFNTDTLNNKNQLDSSGKLIFTALWEESSYTLTYYRNYPTGDTSTSLSYDASGNTAVKTLSNIGFSTPSGYYFVEWNTNANGTGTSYNPGNTVNVNANTNLYAIWEEETVSSYTYTIENRTGRQITITIDGSSISVNNNNDHVVTTTDDSLMLGISTTPLTGYRFRVNGNTYSTGIIILEGTYTITETGDHSSGGYLGGPISVTNLTNFYMGDYPNQVPGKNVSFDFTINYYTSPTSSMSTQTLTTTPGYTTNWVDAANIYVDENHKPTYSISSPPSGSSWRLYIGNYGESDYNNYELLPNSGTFEVGYYQDTDSWYVKLSENQPLATCEINAF